MPGQPPDGWLPLTAAQLGVFVLHRLRPDDPVCSTAELVELPAGIDGQRLTAALDATYAENEQLRVRFRTGPDGPQQQVRHARTPVEVVEVPDRSAADAWLAQRLAIPFALEEGEVVRTAILCVDHAPRWWWHAAHHVVMDGYGFVRFAHRVGEHYRAVAPPVAAVGVAELVAEDRARRAAGTDAEQAFWAERLVGAEGSSSLAGKIAEPTTPAHQVARALAPRLQSELVAAAQTYGIGWTDVATAAFAGYLGRLAPGDPTGVRLGVPFMDRFTAGRGARLTARTVCTAMNILPVCLPVGDGAGRELTVGELTTLAAAELAAVRAQVTLRHEDLARDLRRHAGPGTALFGPQVNLLPFTTTVDFGVGAATVRNLTAGPVEDMTWTIRGAVNRGGPVWLEVAANPLLYGAAEVEATADRLLGWLGTFATAEPPVAVTALPLLSASERRHVIEDLNATERPDLPGADRTLPQAFAAQVAATPTAVALVDEDRCWTYAELAAAVDRLRAALQLIGLRPGEPVGVALPRDARLFVAVHGIVAAGSAYVPLDPEQPARRLAELAADAEVRIVITDVAGAPRLPAGLVTIDLAQVLTDDGPAPVVRPGEPVGPALDDPAYVIFTSGSTGRPKGVVVTHRAIANRLAWMQDRHPIGPGDRVLHKTPMTFDVSVWELFWPLQTGASVIIAPPGAHRDPRRLADLIMTEQVDTVHFVPSMLRALLDDRVSVARLRNADSSPVRRLFCSGEALPRRLVEQAAAVLGVWPVNLYGPTEAAVDVTGWVTGPDETEVPIGRPMPNVRCYVLDRGRRPVPVGTIGHLWLAGVQLARGYAGRPDLTAAAFVPDPFCTGEIMYATGDLARWRSDGALLYEGRADSQVKIAGQRVEPGEVEAVLSSLPGVAAAAVQPVDGPDGARLAAYVIVDPDRSPAADPATWRADLLAELGERLPAALVPSTLQRVSELPVTASGKLDRSALRLITEQPGGSASLPSGWLEERVTAAMSSVLRRPLRVDDDFFDAGGSSLAAIRLLTEVEAVVGRRLALADVFTASTPRRLARRAVANSVANSVASTGDDRAPLLRLRAGEPDQAPLITLPPAGGLGWCYAGLLRHLPAGLPVYAVQADGLREAGSEILPVPRDLDELATRQLDLICGHVGDGPFHLLGWSLGGMAAHAVAGLAERRGLDVRGVIMVDAYPGEQWRRLPEPTEADGLLALVRMAGAEHLVPTSANLDLPLVQQLLAGSGSALAALPDGVRDAVITNALAGARLVRSSTHRRVDGDVQLVVAGAPRPESWLDADGWSPHVGGLVHRIVLDGQHHQLLREPVVGRLGEAVTKIVAGWR